MRFVTCVAVAALAAGSWVGCCAGLQAITDNTSYNAGSEVRLRLAPGGDATASICYAGEAQPVASGIALHGAEYLPLWKIPQDARTGRYEIDLQPSGGAAIRNAASFAVYRQLVKVIAFDLDKTFYTSGDAVNPHIAVRNLSNRRIDHVQVEFESYTYPWIEPASDEPPAWKTIVTDSLSLEPGAAKEFHVEKAAVVQAGKEPVNIYYSVVLRDAIHQDHIYDLAFALPAYTIPPGTPLPKQYPFLYLYQRERDVPKSESYRRFYPPEFVSDAIRFDTSHTMFRAGDPILVSYTLKPPPGAGWHNASIQTRVLDANGRELHSESARAASVGAHEVTLSPLDPGRYLVEVAVREGAAEVASNRLELAVNHLPRSILIFAAHEDDDTAHPGIIRAAVENHIPIHFVYWTGGDAGGCDRFFMHSCDAPRAMDFGEVRLNESRASLGHLGVSGDAISFLGLPDGGLGQIWEHPKSDHPYLSVLLASDHSPYTESAIPNMPYARDAAVAAAKRFLLRYQPDMVITGHPDERHIDHRVNNWIVVKAMQELLAEGNLSRDTQLVVDVAYGAVPNRRAPYKYEKYILNVSGEAARLGQEALWYYQSQDGNHQQAEIVDYDKLPRTEPYPHFRILDWQEHAGWNQ